VRPQTLSPILIQLRNSSYGLHIGQLFLGCAFYADDIALLSASCYGLQRLINICEQYGTAWDIRLNPTKSQLITFGGPNPSVCGIHINGKPIHWVNKIKCLGVYLRCNAGLTGITDSVKKFYGKFNSIMAVLSKHSNEMTTLHLVKSYCLPALPYGCEIWHLNDSRMQKISVAWNNCFRRIFHAAREKALNHYSIFAALCQYHSCYTSANYCFGKNCTALNQLFYSHYLVVCIRLLLLLVVYTMCSRRNCQTTQLEN